MSKLVGFLNSIEGFVAGLLLAGTIGGVAAWKINFLNPPVTTAADKVGAFAFLGFITFGLLYCLTLLILGACYARAGSKAWQDAKLKSDDPTGWLDYGPGYWVFQLGQQTPIGSRFAPTPQRPRSMFV